MRRNDAAVPFALFVSGVVDGLAGFLEAPASAETDRLSAPSQSPPAD